MPGMMDTILNLGLMIKHGCFIKKKHPMKDLLGIVIEDLYKCTQMLYGNRKSFI